MTTSHVEVLEEFIETMDRLVDDFYRYQDGDARTPFSVIRDSIVSALTEYQDVRAAIALMRAPVGMSKG